MELAHSFHTNAPMVAGSIYGNLGAAFHATGIIISISTHIAATAAAVGLGVLVCLAVAARAVKECKGGTRKKRCVRLHDVLHQLIVI